MPYKYLTTEQPKVFPADGVQPVLLNTDKLRFCLIANPSIQEIRQAIDEYMLLRNEELWKWLMGPVKAKTGGGARKLIDSHDHLRLFQSYNLATLLWVESAPILQALNISETKNVPYTTKGMTLDEQRTRVAGLKPTSIPEMLALYKTAKVERQDVLGYHYLTELVDQAATAEVFFGKLIDGVFANLAPQDVYRNGKAPPRPVQARSLEFLGFALSKGWILFPYLQPNSGLTEQYMLMHRDNVRYYFSEFYRGASFDAILTAINEIETAKTTQDMQKGRVRDLMLCSTYRHVQQSSQALFEACLDAYGETEPESMPRKYKSNTSKAYNLLIKIYNANSANVRKIPLTQVENASRVNIQEYAAFTDFRNESPQLSNWAGSFAGFVASRQGTTYENARAACRFLGAFLQTLEHPPLSPEGLARHNVNDYTATTRTLRNFMADLMAERKLTAGSANKHFYMLSQFFDWYQDKVRATWQGHPADEPRLPNPIDLKRDKFEEKYRAGTHRKAIPAHIIQHMRQILAEDDYKWAKENNPYDYTHLANRETGAIDYTWCPSAAILLYLLLSVPIRGLQAQLVDSGDGDSEIFDFATRTMVPNPVQKPDPGDPSEKINPKRCEGLLQLQPSGMTGVGDIIGLWITTNKTSESGYFIPWVDDDLLKHLQYQYNWIRKYAPDAEPRGRTAAQGDVKAKPAELQALEPKFYCLFRDPSAEKKDDPYAPVSKQKLLKLWGKLCAETERRINAAAKGGRDRISLVDDVNAAQPKARFDIHTLRVTGITDLLDRGVPLNIVSEFVAGHATYIMTLWYDKPSPWKIREWIENARNGVGNIDEPLPSFTPEELEEHKEFLIAHPDYQHLFTGFDALEANGGYFISKSSGICPGTRCEEGGLDEQGRASPVPFGDRGPSCPQCRFFLTGPAFLLGQMIEGNQLILKIRKKIQGLEKLRAKRIEAEDAGNTDAADLFSGQADTEERQLNDMLSEWWHRIRFYEASIAKLDEYMAHQKAKASQELPVEGGRIQLFTRASSDEVRYTFAKASEIELQHMLSTCAEILPEFMDPEDTSKVDTELAVGKFLAMNDGDLVKLFFKMSDEQRLTAANLLLTTMLDIAGPGATTQMLAGDAQIDAIPNLRAQVTRMLQVAQHKTITIPGRESIYRQAITLEVANDE